MREDNKGRQIERSASGTHNLRTAGISTTRHALFATLIRDIQVVAGPESRKPHKQTETCPAGGGLLLVADLRIVRRCQDTPRLDGA